MTLRILKTEYFVSRQQECMIVPLWRKGKDTKEIAQILSIPEHEVYNRLPMLRGQKPLDGRIHGLSEKRDGAS